MTSQITLNIHDNAHTNKVILVIDEEFVKSHGQPIPIHRVMNNSNFRQFAQDHRCLLNRADDQQYVRAFIEDVIKQTERIKDKFFMKPNQHDFIYRNNKYRVRNDHELTELLRKHPQGIEVDDELLKYTYRKITADIDRLARENGLRKLFFKKPLDKNNASYMIFAKKEEKELDLIPFHDKHDKAFDLGTYLAICSKLNSVQSGGEHGEVLKNAKYKQSASDPNYKLPFYKEMKQQWMKKNSKK